MDVTEDVGNSLAIEMHSARRAGFIESKVEALAVEQGKHIVEPGITIRKIHRGSLGDDQQMRFESLVLLLQHGVHRRDTLCPVEACAQRDEPHHCRVRWGDVCSSLQNHATSDVDLLSQ